MRRSLFTAGRFDAMRSSPALNLTFGVGTAAGLYFALTRGGGLNALMLWMLGALMSFRPMAFFKRRSPGIADHTVAWLFTGGAFGVLFCGGNPEWRWYLALLGCVAFTGSLFLALRVAVPFAILVLLPAYQAFFNVFFSYPLRWISGAVTTGLLRLCGVGAEWSGTDIGIRGATVTVTAACSGIEQLETMLLLGYVVAVCMQPTFWRRFGHFMLVLPVLVVSNALRLTVTLLVYVHFGDWILSPLPHQVMGWLMVAFAFWLLYIGGALFSPSTGNGGKSC